MEERADYYNVDSNSQCSSISKVGPEARDFPVVVVQNIGYGAFSGVSHLPLLADLTSFSIGLRKSSRFLALFLVHN